MPEARSATRDDVAELVRLRGVMLAAMAGREPGDGGWRQNARRILEVRMFGPNPTLAGFVVDAPDRPMTLAACAIGAVQHRLGGPGDPGGESGYVFNVATDPAYRRRGYSRGCLVALLGWFGDRGIRTIDLRATPDGEPLYRSLGFVASPEAMRLRLP